MTAIVLFFSFLGMCWFAWWLSGVVTDTHFNRLLDAAEKELIKEGKSKEEDTAYAKAKIKKEHKL